MEFTTFGFETCVQGLLDSSVHRTLFILVIARTITNEVYDLWYSADCHLHVTVADCAPTEEMLAA